MKGALSHAVDENLVPRNVADRARPPRDDRNREMSAWTSEETRAFLTSVRSDRLYAMWTLAVTSGMRRGELLGLRWEDVDLETGRLKVRRARISIAYKVEESLPKTAKSRRDIGLDPATVAALRALRRSQLAERLLWGAGYVDSGYVFGKEDGSPLHPDRVSKLFDELVARAGVRRIPLHGLRHTAASLLLEAGLPAKVVQERLGHSSIVVTMDVYSHVIQKLDYQAAGALAEMAGIADVR